MRLSVSKIVQTASAPVSSSSRGLVSSNRSRKFISACLGDRVVGRNVGKVWTYGHLSSKNRSLLNVLAEREGFEPPKGANPCWFSRPVHSTALPPLQKFFPSATAASAATLTTTLHHAREGLIHANFGSRSPLWGAFGPLKSTNSSWNRPAGGHRKQGYRIKNAT